MNRMMRRGWHVVAWVALASLFAALMVGTGVAKTTTVKARGDRWRPLHKYIGKGDKVVWSNPTSKVHDLKSYGGWRLKALLDPGDSVDKKFRQLGTFPYRCVRHSAMVGTKCQGMCGLVHVVA